MAGSENKITRKKIAGVKEIAKRAHVSIATVDRVLHNRPGVAASTKWKIEKIIKELDYKPNLIASRLASSKIFRIAILIPRVSERTDFWQAPLNGIKRAEEEIKDLGFQIDLFLFGLDNIRDFETQANNALASGADGILMAPSFVIGAKLIAKECKKRKIPLVLIDSDIPDQEGIPYIGPHLYSSGRVGAQIIHFTKNDRRGVLILNIAQEADYYNYLKEIELGFRSFYSENNFKADIRSLKVKHVEDDSVNELLNDIYAKGLDPGAIFVTNSRIGDVAQFFEKNTARRPFLMGFDFLTKNVDYLKKGIIDILICHKSEEQGYKGVMTLYQKLLLHEDNEVLNQFMPVDIITKENYEFYHN